MSNVFFSSLMKLSHICVGVSCPANTWSTAVGAASASICIHCADGTWSTAGSGACQNPFCLYNFQNSGVNWALVRHTPPTRWHDSRSCGLLRKLCS